jgi:hypothetical protein
LLIPYLTVGDVLFKINAPYGLEYIWGGSIEIIISNEEDI